MLILAKNKNWYSFEKTFKTNNTKSDIRTGHKTGICTYLYLQLLTIYMKTVYLYIKKIF